MKIKRLSALCASVVLGLAGLFALAPGIVSAVTYNCSWAGGVSGDFNTAGNWTNCNSGVPQNGDNLVFDTSSLTGDATVTDDISGLSIGSITFSGNSTSAYGYDITGSDALTLTNGITDTSNAFTNQVDLDLVLSGNQTFTDTPGADSLIIGNNSYSDTLNLGSNNLTLASDTLNSGGTFIIQMDSQLEGSGNLVMSGGNNGIYDFNAAASGYTGGVSVETGQAYLFVNNALGTGTVAVSSGAVLATNLAGSAVTVSNPLQLAGSGFESSGALQVAAGCPGPGNSGSCSGGTTTFSGAVSLLGDTTIDVPIANTADFAGGVTCNSFSLANISTPGGTVEGDTCASSSSSSSNSNAPKTPDTGTALSKASIFTPILGGLLAATGLILLARKFKHKSIKQR